MQHKPLCIAIHKVTSHPGEKVNGSSKGRWTQTHLTPRKKQQLVKLVGESCLVDCELNGHPSVVLWDTGAQLLIVSQRWCEDNIPALQIRQIEKLTDPGLKLTTANGSLILYLGWIAVDFSLASDETSLMVPFLVTEENISEPIIGYNVISELVKTTKDPSHKIRSSFRKLSDGAPEALINFLQVDEDSGDLGGVRVGGSKVMAPKGQLVTVESRIHTGPISDTTIALFEPEVGVDWPEGL